MTKNNSNLERQVGHFIHSKAGKLAGFSFYQKDELRSKEEPKTPPIMHYVWLI
jgi:hypothetical protein